MLIGTAIQNADAIHVLLESRATSTLGPLDAQARVLAGVGALSQGYGRRVHTERPEAADSLPGCDHLLTLSAQEDD